jgi:hypothetical protein
MGSKKVKTTSQETATTTPNLNPGASPVVTNYFDKLNGLISQPASSLVNPSNSLQQQAYAGASGLNSNGFGAANGLLGLAASSIYGTGPAQTAQSAMPTAPVAQQAATSYAPTAQQATTTYAPTATAGLPTAPTAQQAMMPTAYTPVLAETGKAPTATGVNTNFLSGVSAQSAGGGLASNFLDAYKTPTTQALVDATLATYDQDAARQRAQYELEGARNNAFGGSGYAIGNAELLGEQGRNRALTDAQLRDNAFTRQLQAAAGDADRGTQASIASMQSANSLAGQLAGYQSQAAIADAQAKNQLEALKFTEGNETSRYNAGLQNSLLSQIFGTQADLSKFNAGQANDLASLIYGTGADMSKFNAGQANAANQFNAGASNAASQFNAGQANATNQFNAAQGNAMSQFNTGQANDLMSLIYGQTAQNNQFNAGQANNMSQFNANLGLNRGNSLLNAAQAASGMATAQNADSRANIGLQQDVGNNQYGIDRANSLAPYTQMQLLNELLGGNVLGQTTGRTVNSTGSGTSKESGGLGAALLSGAFGLGSAYLGRG